MWLWMWISIYLFIYLSIYLSTYLPSVRYIISYYRCFDCFVFPFASFRFVFRLIYMYVLYTIQYL
ncbi:hypothetical protein M432DRAFT_622115 [Thermoascus aurantiacus ATCC 26904]